MRTKAITLLLAGVLSAAAFSVPAAAHDGRRGDPQVRREWRDLQQEKRDLAEAYYWRDQALARGDYRSANRAERRIREEWRDMREARRDLRDAQRDAYGHGGYGHGYRPPPPAWGYGHGHGHGYGWRGN